MKEICPLCGRELDANATSHHLIPSTFGGKETVKLHEICHNMIHRTFTERELAKYYHTIDRVLEHDDIQKFVKWVSKKPIEFFVKSKDTKERKGKRVK
jgi:hypothetical protein